MGYFNSNIKLPEGMLQNILWNSDGSPVGSRFFGLRLCIRGYDQKPYLQIFQIWHIFNIYWFTPVHPRLFIMKSPEIPWWGTGRTPAEGLWNDGLPDLAARTKYSACGAADVAQFVSLKTHGGLFWFRQTIRYHTLYIYIYIYMYIYKYK